jgi:hypothetical protein
LVADPSIFLPFGAFNNYEDKMRGRGSKMSVFVHAQGIRTKFLKIDEIYLLQIFKKDLP